jgi:hypothetical protein
MRRSLSWTKGGAAAVRSLALQGRTGGIEPFREFFLAQDRIENILHR